MKPPSASVTETTALPAPTPDVSGKPLSKCLTPEDELEVLIRARYPIIYVVSWEEERVEKQLAEIAASRNKKLHVWTYTQGIVRYGAEPQRSKAAAGSTTDPLSALDAVLQHVEPAIFLFKDFHPFMEENRANLAVIRRLKDVAYHLRDTYKTIVIVSSVLKMAAELDKDITLLQFLPPGVADFNKLLDRIIDDLKDKPEVKINLDPAGRERLVHAARGLTLKEAENVFAKTLVLDGTLDADDVSIVFSEKQQIIKKSGLLEYFATDEAFSSVAGLEHLKQWLVKRSTAFTERAADFGLPSPRGIMLLGVQGCGKSLCAKAVSSLWKLPLLRLDVGRMFGSLVGSSEENIRRAILTAESVAPAILWVDEIDKAFSGSVGSAGSDGGTAQRVFSTFLTWLSDKTTPVFVIATANDISQLPPELLRKGRLDEIFFVDLPSEEERRAIFAIHLEKRRRSAAAFDLPLLARHSDGFSGAEIEQVIVSALFDAFSDNSDLDTRYILASIAETVPLSKTMSESLDRLRTWAQGRARPASGSAALAAPAARRKIEF
ncbi:MAG TPA: AAA family ATPase [Tepidisphaeraceae bacterium]|jgi:ATP-dependent 26S proteasome regulatory subunit|nr:AAA family ATPase [Tepidisphaeraceae bacterium]